MEKFLEDEDRKEERKSSQPEEDEEDMIDLFDDVGDEDEAGTMYGQYFNEEDTGQDEGGEFQAEGDGLLQSLGGRAGIES